MKYFKETTGRAYKELAKGARTQTFWGENILLSLVTIDSDSEVPWHTHPHEQAGILVEGELEMGIGDEVKILHPGDMYIIPGDLEHYAKTSSKSAVALDIFSPVREEFKY